MTPANTQNHYVINELWLEDQHRNVLMMRIPVSEAGDNAATSVAVLVEWPAGSRRPQLLIGLLRQILLHARIPALETPEMRVLLKHILDIGATHFDTFVDAEMPLLSDLLANFINLPPATKAFTATKSRAHQRSQRYARTVVKQFGRQARCLHFSCEPR